MNKRDFLRALAKGKTEEALRIIDELNSEAKDFERVVVHYPYPLADKPTKEQKSTFDKFCKKAEKEYPNKGIIYITVRERKPPQ